MGRFSRSAPRPRSADEFVAGAETHAESTDEPQHQAERTATSQHRAPREGTSRGPRKRNAVPQCPWERFSKKATAKNIFNLRLNDYYLAILRHLAAHDEDRSMQQIVKEIVLPELERLAGIASGTSHNEDS